MKKVISILMIMVMLVSVFAIPVFADDNVAQEYVYLDEFIQRYEEYRYGFTEAASGNGYKEWYYHYSSESDEEPDWTLIYSRVLQLPSEWKYGTVVGDRVLYVEGGGCIPFSLGYGVYVKSVDEFIGLSQDRLERIIELCPDFVEVIEENKIGCAFGDVNGDNELTIIDATYIQRKLAGYDVCFDHNISVEIPADDSYNIEISDFNRDGDTTILDATAIQRKLAKLD